LSKWTEVHSELFFKIVTLGELASVDFVHFPLFVCCGAFVVAFCGPLVAGGLAAVITVVVLLVVVLTWLCEQFKGDSKSVVQTPAGASFPAPIDQ